VVRFTSKSVNVVVVAGKAALIDQKMNRWCMENKYDFEVKIAEQAELIRLQAAEIERITTISDNYHALCVEANLDLAALKQAGVVIPGPITGSEMGEYGAAMRRGYDACRREVARLNASRDAVPTQPELSVWCGAMPESNGKSNYTALLHRKGESLMSGATITLDRSEYPERVQYEADRVRYLIGELPTEPDILAYDPDKHSGYAATTPAPARCEYCDVQALQSERDALAAENLRLREALDNIGGLTRALRAGGPDPMDLQGLSDALEEATDTAHAALSSGKEVDV
jgi:hypothetical protein